MPRYRHPRALDGVEGHPPHRVHVSRAENAPVDDEGTFACGDETAVRQIAEAFGVDVETLRVGAESGAETPESDTPDGSDADTDGYECGASLSGDGVCTREVDAPGERCWQHTEDD